MLHHHGFLPTRRRLTACLVAAATVAVAAACSGAGPAAQTRSVDPTHDRTHAAGPTHAASRGTHRTTASATSSAPSPRVPPPGTPTGRPVVLAFGGDVHFMGVDGVRLADDPATAIGPVAAILRRADLAMVNLETAVTTGGTPTAGKQYVFRAPPSAFRALRDAGIDVVTMANNHGMDYGLTGLRDSVATAHRAGFPVVGIGLDAAHAFAPYRVTVKGQRIAVIGATQVIDSNLISAWTAGPGKPGLASAKEIDELLAAVRAARAGADTVVVYLHYGRELSTCPTSDQLDIADELVEAGADIVVGSHAHVVLGGGWHGSAYVDYGLGNFVFYSSSGLTAHSGVLELTVAGRAVTKARWVPAVIEGGVPVPLSGSAAAEALAGWQALRGCTGLSPEPRS